MLRCSALHWRADAEGLNRCLTHQQHDPFKLVIILVKSRLSQQSQGSRASAIIQNDSQRDLSPENKR